MSQASLIEIQRWMRWLITDPRGVDSALKNPHPENPSHPTRYTRPGDDYLPMIQETPNLLAPERLTIYAEGYFARILESISDNFSLLKRYMDVQFGQDEFIKMIANFLKSYPSRFTNIEMIGQDLEVFLQSYPLGEKNPLLSELAAIEWAAIQAFYADDTNALDPQYLQNIPAEAWPSVSFQIHSSVQILNFSQAVDRLWRATGDDEFKNFAADQPQAVQLAIYRTPQNRVQIQNLENLQAQVLRDMQLGKNLTAICEGLGDISAPPPFMQWFAEWIQSGIITQITQASGAV